MSKKTKIILLIILAVLVLSGIAILCLNRKKDDSGSLGGHVCLSKFRVERGTEYSGGKEPLKLESFQSFDSGAFFGKIKGFKPGQNEQFSALIDELMKEQKIATLLHLRADVCLYNQDLLNPENGASLIYYVEHYYCTNRCQTGSYELRVDLDADGNFVGYRKSD